MLSVWESYFYVSDVRTHDLKEIAKTNGLGEPLHWPDYKEVRFAEFSHHLFAVFLRNYRCYIKYCEKQNDVESLGFLRKWTDKDLLHLVTLLADVTYLLKGLQKSLQKQTCILSDLSKVRERFVKELENVKGSPLTGGWEEAFLTGIDENNMFLGIQLTEQNSNSSCICP